MILLLPSCAAKEKETDNLFNKRKELLGEAKHVLAGSVECERLFSQAKLTLTANRRLLKEETFESIMFLKMNKKFWDVLTVKEMLNICKSESPNQVISQSKVVSTSSVNIPNRNFSSFKKEFKFCS